MNKKYAVDALAAAAAGWMPVMLLVQQSSYLLYGPFV